ncbi:hypothetical protein BH23ACT2_BH23ACT2_05940 [soil metagenome]
MFIDLDRFKALNDRHGHVVGDQALAQIAHRLEDAAGERGRVARYAGDEFCVAVHDPGDIEAVAAAVQVAMAASFSLDTGSVRISASVGSARSTPGDTARDLVHCADQAMYRAKSGAVPPSDDDPTPSAPSPQNPAVGSGAGPCDASPPG